MPLSKSVKMEDLRGYFHLPIVEVAKQLGTCTTALKKICRKNKIRKWPYRQIRSITKSIQSLEMASLNDSLQDELRIQYREQINTLQKAIDDLIHDPNANVNLVNMKLDIGPDDNDDGDNELHEERKHIMSKPMSSNVHHIMMAAAASAGIESARHIASVKRKSDEVGGEGYMGAPGTHHAKSDEPDMQGHHQLTAPAPSHPAIVIGDTIVNQISNAGDSSSGRGKVHFVGPVQLAALQRKKLKISKKLVPLIEPDICNHFRMDFLPQSILQYKYLHTPGSTNNVSSSVMDYQHIQQQHMVGSGY